MAGLLDLFGERSPEDPVNYGLLDMAGALGTPVSRGGGVGPAFAAYGRGMQTQQQLVERRKLMDAQMQHLTRDKDYMTVGKHLFNIKTGQFVPLPEGMNVDELPKDVVSFNEFMKKTPEDQQKWLDFKRNNYDVNNVGGVPSVNYKGVPVPGGAPSSQPLSTLPLELEAAARKKQAEESGKVTGETAGKAQVGLASANLDLANTEKVVNGLKNHAGQEWAVGVPIVSQLPEQFTLAGTQHADFLAKYKQAQGQVFLKGYETLKGGGSITEVEGAQAKAAIAAMDRSQSKKQFNEALDDYMTAYKNGIQKLRQQKALGDINSPEGIRATGESMVGPRSSAGAYKPANQMTPEEIRAELEAIRNRGGR